jgi:hypothetical protein
MPFCTIVEFEWDESFGREQFAAMIEKAGPVDELPAGCVSRIVGVDDAGARVIEVWRSGADAAAFAKRSAPDLAGLELPPPSRVTGFETTAYVVAPAG